MANELIIMPRKFDQPIKGDKMQMQGDHVRPGGDIRVDADNTDSYTVPEHGVEYVELEAISALWYIIADTATNAVVGQDEYLGAGQTRERTVTKGQVIKAIVHS